MKYLHWKENTVTDLSDSNISSLYDQGFLFTRIAKGVMHQTRSVRVDLSKFELSSENRRIIKKTDLVSMSAISLPLETYHFQIGKMAKDFYDIKFGKGVMSVQKIKEMITDKEQSNWNRLLQYKIGGNEIGYTISYDNADIRHYSYPFYDLLKTPKDMGLGMMIRAVIDSKERGQKFIYLGSLQRPNDTYKLQFSGIEWFDGEKWVPDIKLVKHLLSK